jgi:hypothetical protein
MLLSLKIIFIIIIKESNSTRRPYNLHLLYSPGPSKNFLFIDKGQLEDVEEGS